MHLDTSRLAAYLDNALDSSEHAAARAHLLTCAACVARMERLRADEQMIKRLAHAGAVPDVRAAVRAKRRLASPLRWMSRGAAFASALAVLLLFALLIGARSGGTLGWSPDRLFVVSRNAGTLTALNAADGAPISTVTIGEQPRQVLYDRRADRLYVLDARGIAAVDPQTLQMTARWTPSPNLVLAAAMALDEQHGRIFLAWSSAGVISALDTATLTPASLTPDGRATLQVGSAPGELALAPDGRTLYTFDTSDGSLWAVDLLTLTTSSHSFGQRAMRNGWLAVSADGQAVYVLLGSTVNGAPPELRRIDTASGQISAAVPITASPAPWDLLLLGDHLTIARGDGQRGGVELVTTSTLRPTARIDPAHDQHHLAAGPADSLFALNWLHGTVTRYELSHVSPVWQIKLDGQPWDGVYVPAGWHWPF